MTIPTEDEFAAYMKRLHELEVSGERQTVAFGPFTAIVLIGLLQFATRHPDVSEEHRAMIGSVIDQFRPWFAGTMGEQIIDMGNDPALDRVTEPLPDH